VNYDNLFNCQIDLFPFKYLGVPILVRVDDWAKMEGKSYKKFDIWQENSLSIAGRTTLINGSLISLTIYHMSMFLLLKTMIK
jgi:ABC-type maltose transport system permease subunit